MITHHNNLVIKGSMLNTTQGFSHTLVSVSAPVFPNILSKFLNLFE